MTKSDVRSSYVVTTAVVCSCRFFFALRFQFSSCFVHFSDALAMHLSFGAAEGRRQWCGGAVDSIWFDLNRLDLIRLVSENAKWRVFGFCHESVGKMC